ncbi:MAG TPA: GvpL/GvpF family gas vesicle protein, partial [Vicinamibacteria bacterium]|nr:GvpL/GvpF family gas vesicle protein [Vicinamibacteria bacterium]
RDLDWVSACAMGHERVAEHFLGQGTLLPMKLFTLFTSDEAAVAQSQGDARRVARLRDRLRDRVEWGIRLRRRDEAPAPRAAGRARSGREFLQRKAQARALSRGERSGDRARAAAVLKSLRTHAADAVRKELPDESGRLLLDAVLLVDRAKAAGLRRAVALQARALAREGIELVLTGPWPAYHFLDTRR